MAVFPGLGGHPLQGDHHVTQGNEARAGVRVLPAGVLPGFQVEFRKTQHIGGPVHSPHIQVHGVDARIVGKEHVHLAGKGHALRRQGRAEDLADQGGRALVHGFGNVAGDDKAMGLVHYFRPFPPFFAVS